MGEPDGGLQVLRRRDTAVGIHPSRLETPIDAELGGIGECTGAGGGSQAGLNPGRTLPLLFAWPVLPDCSCGCYFHPEPAAGYPTVPQLTATAHRLHHSKAASIRFLAR